MGAPCRSWRHVTAEAPTNATQCTRSSTRQAFGGPVSKTAAAAAQDQVNTVPSQARGAAWTRRPTCFRGWVLAAKPHSIARLFPQRAWRPSCDCTSTSSCGNILPPPPQPSRRAFPSPPRCRAWAAGPSAWSTPPTSCNTRVRSPTRPPERGGAILDQRPAQSCRHRLRPFARRRELPRGLPQPLPPHHRPRCWQLREHAVYLCSIVEGPCDGAAQSLRAFELGLLLASVDLRRGGSPRARARTGPTWLWRACRTCRCSSASATARPLGRATPPSPPATAARETS